MSRSVAFCTASIMSCVDARTTVNHLMVKAETSDGPDQRRDALESPNKRQGSWWLLAQIFCIGFSPINVGSVDGLGDWADITQKWKWNGPNEGKMRGNIPQHLPTRHRGSSTATLLENLNLEDCMTTSIITSVFDQYAPPH